MRRDYFTCVFLGCICAALFFVYFTPSYFIYGGVTARPFGILETICAWIYALTVLVALPVYAAYKKKFWITAGLMAYGAFASLPLWFLPKLMSKLSGDDASIVAVIEGYLLKAIYRMATAPFGAISRAFGDKFSRMLPFRILPVALILYIGVQLFRFYRNAYVMEQLSPATAIDMTAKENAQPSEGRKVRDARIPEVLGTVISAPSGSGARPVREPVKPQPSSETVRVARMPVREPMPEVDGNTKAIHLGPHAASAASGKKDKTGDNTEAIRLGPPKGAPASKVDDSTKPIRLGPPKT